MGARSRLLALGLCVDVLAACGGGAPADAGIDAARADAGTLPTGDSGCPAGPDDYTPRILASSTDSWPPCISDQPGPDGPFTPIGTTISSVARTEAFDTMFAPGGLLADATRDPSPAEFTNARVLYEVAQGIGSRVVRRSDEHYPQPSPADCQMGAIVAASPHYCVGPTELSWIAQSAFVAGITAVDPPSRIHAARLEAALTWFLFLSVYKESESCTDTAADCDSSWGYYCGGVNDRAGGIGISRLVRALDDEAHQRIWDAELAVRCWRDLDPAPLATMLTLRDRARAQQDRALLRGAALVIVDRLRRMAAATGDEQRAHYEWLRTLLASLPAHLIPSPDPMAPDIAVDARESLADRMIRERSVPDADAVLADFDSATGPADIDAAGIASRLEALFPCP